MAAGLTGKYPQIKSGLERILASGPKSNLSVNSELKTVELINTPWTKTMLPLKRRGFVRCHRCFRNHSRQ